MALIALTPVLLAGFLGLYAALCGIEVYDCLLCGARKGLALAVELLPALILLFAAIYSFRASGFTDYLAALTAPLLERIGVPPETSLLLLLRPLSGSAAMAVSTELMQSYGADSLIGRTAAVMIGSSETTFYVLAVYGSASELRRTRWIVPSALCADLVCFLSSAWVCRLFWT